MINEIKTFLFILSVLFISKLIIEFIIKLIQPITEPLKFNDIEKVTIYLSISYIITFLIT
jgi:hypothetical protein